MRSLLIALSLFLVASEADAGHLFGGRVRARLGAICERLSGLVHRVANRGAASCQAAPQAEVVPTPAKVDPKLMPKKK